MQVRKHASMRVVPVRMNLTTIDLRVGGRTVATTHSRANGWFIRVPWINLADEPKSLNEAETAGMFVEAAVQAVRVYLAEEERRKADRELHG